MAGNSAEFHESEERLRPQTMEHHRAIVSLMEELEAVDWYDQRVNATDALLAFRHGRLVYDFYLGRPIPQIRDTRELQPLLDTPHPLYVLTDERGWRILTTGSAGTWSVVDRTEIAGRAVMLLRHAPGRPDGR